MEKYLCVVDTLFQIFDKSGELLLDVFCLDNFQG